MNTNEEKTTIEVCYPAWAESEKSWYFLTKTNDGGKSWTKGKWFPKKKCELETSPDSTKAKLTMPTYLHDKIMNS